MFFASVGKRSQTVEKGLRFNELIKDTKTSEHAAQSVRVTLTTESHWDT